MPGFQFSQENKMTAQIKGFIRPYHSRLTFLFRLIDFFWIFALLWVFVLIRGISFTSAYVVIAALSCILFYIFSDIRKLHTSWRGGNLLGAEIKTLWLVWIGVISVDVLLGFATKTSADYSRLVILHWMFFVPVVLSLWRVLIRSIMNRLRRVGRNSRTVAIAGAGALGLRLAETILSSPYMGMRLTGFFDDFKEKDISMPQGGESFKIRGNLDEMVTWALTGNVDIIYIALPKQADERIRELVERLADSSVFVYVVPDLYFLDLLNARWVNLGGISAVSIYESPYDGFDGWLKRFEDLLLGSLILIIVALPMIIIAIGIKFSSPGPVIFKQKRHGLRGKILVWKFRTMSVCEDGDVIEQARRNDPRVTRFGAFLRKTSLDELPQFINVLQGRMSIVGPRPHAVAHNEYYRKLIPGYMLRHRVRPGITGLAQVHGWRGETDTVDKMENRVKDDIQYLRNWSIWLDIKIIFLTVFGKKAKRNAH